MEWVWRCRIFIRNALFLNFDVSILDDSYGGILWLKLSHKSSSICILPCVCYLPPEKSSRFFDVNNFYDLLLADFYKYQNEGLIYVCGDFNSRCGDLDDFIRGVDKICDREVIDFSLNKYDKFDRLFYQYQYVSFEW